MRAGKRYRLRPALRFESDRCLSLIRRKGFGGHFGRSAGRFLKSVLIATPPCLRSLITAVPTHWPLASFISTVIGLLAA